LSISEAFQLFISKKKCWKKPALQHLIKHMPFSIAQVTTRKTEGCYTQGTVCIYRKSHSSGVKFWKRLYLDKTWTNNKLCTFFFTAATSKDRYQSIFLFISFISTTRTNWKQRTSTNQSFDSQVLITLKQGKITQVQKRTNWMQFVPFLTSLLKLVSKTIYSVG